MSDIPIPRIVAALTRKGFVTTEGDHTRIWYRPQERRSAIVTRFSHGERKADEWLQRLMSRQLHLSRAEFASLIDCSLTAEDYQRLMEERGHLKR